MHYYQHYWRLASPEVPYGIRPLDPNWPASTTYLWHRLYLDATRSLWPKWRIVHDFGEGLAIPDLEHTYQDLRRHLTTMEREDHHERLEDHHLPDPD